MANYSAGRDAIVRALQRELVGPAAEGKELDTTGNIVFGEASESYGPWRQKGSGEEIITRDSPSKRYGVGVLYPFGIQQEIDTQIAVLGLAEPDQYGQAGNDEFLTEQGRKSLDAIAERDSSAVGGDTDDFDLSTANAFKPNSMAISFLAEMPSNSWLIVEASGGRYKRITVDVDGRERVWWLRSPVTLTAKFRADTVRAINRAKVVPDTSAADNLEGLDVRIEVYSRPYEQLAARRLRLVTVCLINRTQATSSSDQICLFQSHFKAEVRCSDGNGHILPYPGPVSESPDEEEQSLALLYQRMKTFAVGHGCAANWGNDSKLGDRDRDSAMDVTATMDWVSAESLPVVEVPSITPDIKRKDGTAVEVPMAALAGLIPGDDGLASLQDIVLLYEAWIKETRGEITGLRPEFQKAAALHIEECFRCAQRMRDGLEYLESNQTAQRAFRFANHAMLLQQIRSGREPRKARFDEKAKRIIFSEPYSDPDPLGRLESRGTWRAFQIAFLLMAIRSAGEGQAPARDTVELIWFPTGGGKTEAYLGLAAFSMFKNRLERPDEAGVHTLMRYTLRLLTAQQFQRASGLICAMEHLRKGHLEDLGQQAFSIGIWLGASMTPNTREEARAVLRELEDGEKHAENKFILSRCPWCRAQMGPLKFSGKPMKGAPHVIGYERQSSTVVFKCFDRKCEFSRGLPIYVIDDDIYDVRPSLIIGTVDKFALLAWQPHAQAMFGITNGQRVGPPPNLIIQDELHLISGPLGSMVGLYEAIIEELCTDRRGPHAIRPKIVSSTATIRRYAAQIQALYARKDVALFPPPGLDAGDSFFARYARYDDGSLQRGSMYVGVHAPGLGSLQTAQVRTFTTLLQAPLTLPPEERDPWWTLLLFFNSLRELGTTLSLFQSDIPDYLLAVKNRTGMDFSQLRRLWDPLELTGRLRNEEVPQAISALEAVYSESGERAVDVCLASNIIEVGIDIDRISLMSIVGQPKTTSQYIQVAGRVGRRWWERPGLVVTIYGAAKPRDRSHFEKFRTYHERLYAQVEPTSVTPMSPPVLSRALHAVMAAYARQAGDKDVAKSPYPYPEKLIDNWHDLLLPRVSIVDPTEIETFERVFAKRKREWQTWNRRLWTATPGDTEIPLLRVAGEYASYDRTHLSWPTPLSLRDVDAECRAVITRLYAMESGESNGN